MTNRFMDLLRSNQFIIFTKVIGAIALLIFSDHYVFGERISDLMNAHGAIHVVVFLSLWLLCFISLIYFSFFSRFIVRLVITVIFFVSTLVSLSYLDISGVSITYDSLYVLIENINFASEGVNEFFSEILSALVISLFSLTLLLSPPAVIQKFKNSLFVKRTNYVVAFIPFFVLFAISWPRGGYGLEQIPVQYKVPVLTSIIYFEKAFIGSPERLSVDEQLSNNALEKNNIVLIVDESVRADYLDINNDQGVTPYLMSQKDRLINFGYTTSGSNCSSASNQILRFGPNKDNFSQTYVTNPYIWEYAKKAGYETIMLEGQLEEGQLNNGMKFKEKKYIDHYIYATGKTNFDKDKDIADLIKKYTSVKREKPVFIYAVKSGVHFPYKPLTPQDKKLFKKIKPPQDKNVKISKKRHRIHNYKNAVHYLTDSFFKQLLDGTSYEDSIIIYTSDHGQNLFDNGQSITHCSVEDITPFEALVPLVVFTDNPDEVSHFTKAAEANKNKASHFNIFPTIVKLFGYDEKDMTPLHGNSVFSDCTGENKFVTGRLSENRLYQNGVSTFDLRNKWNFIPENIRSH